MPRIAGVHLAGGLLAAGAIYVIGALWFGLVFDQVWMDANGYTEAQIVENFSVPIFAGGGAIIPLVLAFTLGWLLRKTETKGLMPCIIFGAQLGIFLAAPLLAYSFVYNIYHSWSDLLLDASHSLIGFIIGCAVLSFFD